MREHYLRTLNNPKSLTAEAYRTLRTNIQFASVENAVRHILFTSAGPQEGKSSIVANLAVSMSQAAKRVLIIDADLRNPSQHKVFNLCNLSGLTNTLVENASAFSYIMKTPYEGLDVLTSGPIPTNPAELLDSGRINKILDEISRAYHFVFIDSPPVVAITDASILAQSVDGVILVLAAQEADREYALRAKEQLERVGAKILGIVLNKAKIDSLKDYYYYHYEEEDPGPDTGAEDTKVRNELNHEKGKTKIPKLCLVSSSGGHWEQLRKLQPLLDKYKGFYVTEKTRFECDAKYLMIQTDLKDKWMPLKMLRNAAYALYIWFKEYPDFIITTGTMIAYPFYLLAILFRKKFVFIETYGRASMPTVAGKTMEKHTDLFIVQWESQKEYYQKAIYVGCLY